MATRCGLAGNWRVPPGSLFSYGPVEGDFGAATVRAADYVASSLRGAKPADMPVEHPSKYDLVIKLKTAKPLGRQIPQALLLGAPTR